VTSADALRIARQYVTAHFPNSGRLNKVLAWKPNYAEPKQGKRVKIYAFCFYQKRSGTNVYPAAALCELKL
jgi:hypothetical protein